MLKKVLFLVFVLTAATSVFSFSQTGLNARISIVVKDEPLFVLLSTIEEKCKFTFIFNSSILDQGRLVSIEATDVAVKDILSSVLGSQYEFAEYGNQVAIRKKALTTKEEPPISPSKIKRRVEDEDIVNTSRTSVVLVYDTLFKTITDTTFLRVTDTVKVLDTVMVKLKKTVSTTKSKFNISLAISPLMLSKTTHLGNNEEMYGDMVSNSESQYKGISYGVLVDYPIGMLSVKSGLVGVNLSKDIDYCFEYTYIDSNDVYTDSSEAWVFGTVLKYHKFLNGDTVSVTVFDSSRQQLSFSHFKTKTTKRVFSFTNQMRYLQVPISVGIPLQLGRRHWLTPVLACRLYFLYSASGYLFNTAKRDVQKIGNEMMTRVMASVGASLHYSFRLHNYSTLFVEPSFNTFLTSIYKEVNVVNERIHQYYISTGIRTTIFER